ncbi:UDP-N-acetylmuramate dehydrogenase [Thermoanaerobacterium sp. DL9XJH110]|uniref:UDP-N-acetylmuramate dehydrogenase n=1 Tax=Thermoanaerobacterium sp. DL9XJH110 TaxID=3386643 RepID=UPI003BB75C43
MDLVRIYNELKNMLSEDRIKIKEPLKNHTSFRIGGPADILILPVDVEEVRKAVMLFKKENIPFFVMGNGTNLLVKDRGIRGAVIKLAQNFNDIEVENNILRCKAGVPLSVAARAAQENSLSGLEFASGIPGTVGGAVVMNAGAYGGEMADVVSKVKVLDMDGNVYEMSKNELEYSYRRCVLQRGDRILLEIEMELKPGNPDEIKMKMEDYLTWRKEKQPLNFPSAGSAFKRPPGNFAGRLIEKAGLKGYRIGGAMVSDLHAGFIVNVDNATCEDVLKLISHIQKVIKDKFDVDLELEIQIKGE